MSKLCQKDPRWANMKIGNTNLSFQDFGCYMFCLAMLRNLDPREVNKLFTKYGGYTPDGLINNEVAYRLIGLTYLGKGYSDPGKLCIGTTNYYATKKNPELRHFFVLKPGQIIVDPLTGLEGRNKYQNYMVSYRLLRYG